MRDRNVKMTIPRSVPFNLIVAVSGSRKYQNAIRMNEILDDLHRQRIIKLLIQGECPEKNPEGVDGGADELARLWAKHNEVNSVSVPPKSRKIRWPGCGPARNREMAKWMPPPQVWVMFPGAVGTQSARDIADEFHITRLEVTEDDYSWMEHRPR